ncbi:hypothetical protein YPPY72_2498 [Yersinia pestis PY-72]|nr:hypothetical protein YPPY07_2364 [Yersinia pestis PY-07]EIR31941.1 hypothetical protein YPPY10_2513 [Yersinia pestis PY-10]EIS18686.1 hypothetical protein YPPY53_2520 [Yersinia pestis PY-53]EIS32117.1 hypothetical protein YPPY56_2522 [Yersinia pestis PY-56]EIS76972.1 hypothetical protein YPPY71_2276 [Yersinia pestis PY-71]EIS79128.1 hypothetical protein YPPY72_2498 [Yersinia pestis PY-72]EIT58677.1 hypothetical protein YPPY103_2602 [Yersinia pestis PY-103]
MGAVAPFLLEERMLVTDPTSPDFNSYASAENLTAFALARAMHLPTETEPLLIKAMDYLNGLNWYGSRAKLTQPLPWPRSDIIFDGFSYPSTNIPPQLITAQCMLAVEAIDGELLGSNREAAIKSEAVSGAVSITYAVSDTESFTPNYPAVMAILRGFVAGSGFAINAIARRE